MSPGLQGFITARQQGEQENAQQLQQAGTLFALAQKMKESQRDQAFRGELAALGSAPEQSALAALAAKYSTPKDLLAREQGSLDRQAGIQAAKETKAAALEQAKATAEQTHEFRMSRLTGEKDRAAETARHNQAMELLQGQIAQFRVNPPSKPPPGYRPTQDGNLEAIPGGPADLKIQGQFNQDTSALNSMTNDMDRLAAEANRLKDHPGLGKATGLMAAVPLVGGVATIPGTDSANFKAGLETLKSQVAFGVLQNMRNNSKTGGALGQVSDKEGQLLAANLAALDRAQSPEEFKAALGRILDYTEKAKDRLRAAYNLKHKGAESGAATAAPAEPASPSAPPSGSGWSIKPRGG